MATNRNWPDYVAPDAANEPFVIDAGVLCVGGHERGDVIGTSRGGFKFDPGITMREVEFDGKSTPVIGNHRITLYDSRITGQLLLSKTRTLPIVAGGGSSDGSSGVNTTTPRPARDIFSSGDYLDDIYLLGNRTDGEMDGVYFKHGLVVKWSQGGQDNNEWVIDFELQAVNPAATPNIAPYKRLEVEDIDNPWGAYP